MTEQTRLALVCGITADHDFALAALLLGFQRHNPDFAGDVVVFHDGLSGAQQRLLGSLGPKVQFRPYDRDRMLDRLGPQDTDATRARLAEIVQRYSPLMLAKLELPDLLDHYSHAVWMDVDMLVQAALPDLFDFSALAWRPLPTGWQKRRRPLLTQFDHLWRNTQTPFPNGGLVGIARGTGLHSADLYDLARQVLETVDTVSIDEAALFLAATSRGIAVREWPMSYNHLPAKAGVEQAAVVHAVGPQKFWNTASLITAFPDWQAHHALWGQLGGRMWQGTVSQTEVEPITLDGRIDAARQREHWLRLFDGVRPNWPMGLVPDLRFHGRDWTIWITGQADTTRLVLGVVPNLRKVSVRLVIDAPPAQVPALVRRLQPQLDRIGPGFGFAPRTEGLEFQAVVQVAKLAGILGQIRDLVLKSGVGASDSDAATV